MSDTVYAIASGKGGVGKTTTAVNLGATLADRGNSVVVLDTDLGMANLAGFLDFEIEDPTLHEVLAGEADPEDGIYEAPGGIDVLPSSTDIEAFAKSDPSNLESVVADLRETYDYVLLDTGAGVSYDTLIPLALADAVLLVATPDVASVRDTAKTGELAARVGSNVEGAILTKRSSDILNADDVEETLGTDVLAVIPEDEAVPMGIDAGRPLSAFAPNAPAGRAYHDLAAILDGDAVPDPELSETEESDTATEADETASEADVENDVFDTPESDDEATPESDGERSADDESADPPADLEGTEADGADAVDTVRADAETADTPDEDGWSEDPFADVDDADEESSDPLDATTSDDTDDGARSVDDLISQHIDDERLGDDDPLASVEDSLEEAGDETEDDAAESVETEEAADTMEDDADDPLASPSEPQADDTAETADFEDPLEVADEEDTDAESDERADSDSSGSDSVDSDSETSVASDSDSLDDPKSADAGDDLESATPAVGAVPFEGDGPSDDVSSVERDAQSVGNDDSGETVLADEVADGESSSDDGDRTSQDDNSETDDKESANSGVLGRLGSLFK